MAEGYHNGAYHVPQQSRRDKLRVLPHNYHNLYDPSSFLSPPDFLSSSSPHYSNFMGFITNSPHHHHHNPNFIDPNNNSPHINPSSEIHLHNSSNPFLNFPNSHHPSPYSDGDSGVVMFKPEPLSLSLSSSHHRHSTSSGALSLPLELNFQRYMLPNSINVGGGGATPGSGPNGGMVSRCSDVVPLGPFTGYASILEGSRFLKPAKQLLEEFCEVSGCGGGGGLMIPAGADRFVGDPSLLNPGPSEDPLSCAPDVGSESRRRKCRLISMLDEVYRRYKQYYQQMQAVVTSFECVAGLGNAAPYANLALKAMSKHFRSLKTAITDQLGKPSGKDGAASAKLGTAPYGSGSRHVQSSSGGGVLQIDHQQPVWRPQRGLPERAVTVLRAWLFEHFLHPYPTDTDKLMLAKQTGLTRNQVSNWFINARVRLWKPMVEEVHMLETRQAAQKDGGNNRSMRSDHHQSATVPPPMSNSDAAPGNNNPSTSSDIHNRTLDAPMSKRTRNEHPTTADVGGVRSNEERHQHLHQEMYMQTYGGGGLSNMGMGSGSDGGGVSGGGGVSLTLGLHQGIGLLEPPPPSFAISSAAAQRFGLDIGGYVMGGFEGSQNRHFGRDFVGGQLLHDFVG